MEKFVISLTGHRPDKLWGYNLTDSHYIDLQTKLETLIQQALNKHDVIECHSGMALGADTIWAQAIVSMKKRYPNNVIFVADIPCEGQESVWPPSSQKHYTQLLQLADKKIYYSEKYTRSCMQQRNIGMIDAANVLIAITNGDIHGGTANAIAYAQKTRVSIYKLNI